MDRDEIVMIAGASMGMFTGYALAADKLDELEHIYRSIDIPKKSELFWQVFAHDLLAATTESIVKAGDVLDIPFCFPVCVLSLCPVRYYLLHGPFNRLWPKYMHAGVNYPFLKIFPSVVEHRLAIDGGAMDNIPLYPILKKGKQVLPASRLPDFILALHFDSRYDHRKDFQPEIPVLDVDISICNDFKKEHYNFSHEYLCEMLEAGERYGEELCKELFTGDVSREGLQKKADEIFLREHGERQRHISVDRLFSMLNTIGKLLRRDAANIKKLY